jgi:hypothetical protein
VGGSRGQTLYKSIRFTASPLQTWRWRLYVSPKRWLLPTSLHEVKGQKITSTFSQPRQLQNSCQ